MCGSLPIEAATNEGVLDIRGFAQHSKVDRVHVVAVNPDLAHHNIGRSVALNLCCRGPDMLGEVAQPRSSGALGLEYGLVAEQHRDGDGKDDREQPMPCGGSAMSLESSSDGV